MEIQFTESAQLNTLEYGSCFVSAWPRPSKNSVVVDTNSGSCKIVILSIRFNDEYTTIAFFAIHVNSSCDHIICSGPSGVKKRAVNICKHCICPHMHSQLFDIIFYSSFHRTDSSDQSK